MVDIQDAGDRVAGGAGPIGSLLQDTAEFAQAAQALQQYVAAGASAMVSVSMEPDSVKQWLEQFGDKLKEIAEQRRRLMVTAGVVSTDVKVGSFPPSLQIRQKMSDRMGNAEGGLAWALSSVVLRLADIHETLRKSLAAHIDTDLDNMKIIDSVKSALT